MITGVGGPGGSAIGADMMGTAVIGAEATRRGAGTGRGSGSGTDSSTLEGSDMGSEVATASVYSGSSVDDR